MPVVQTVRGPIETIDLGRTYMHEHIFLLNTEVQQNFPDEWGDEDARIADAVAKLTALTEQGVTSMVDMTVLGLGRCIPRIQKIAERVPQLNIIVATGCYTYRDVPFYFSLRPLDSATLADHRTRDPMVDMFVHDIVEGIAGTGVKAGMLKCAIGEPGLTDGVERVMRAVAQAHLETYTPITVHTDSVHQRGLDVKRVMVDQMGVAPERVVLGHTGDTTDLDHITELAEAGFILGFDRFGLHLDSLSWQSHADTLIEACRRGLADQIVLSHDQCCYTDWASPSEIARLTDSSYLHLGDEVVPYLRAHGVTDDQIDTMLVDVPRRVFEQAARPK
ncbi:phosphotriesterase [Nocardia sp. NPDC049149]|uniref:phosphotriesterase family protein n=1 Tax=Nocardia sp. NPDC049149 TaxID=3364315 RepID=UPI003712F0BF